jgi:hypothetical protein
MHIKFFVIMHFSYQHNTPLTPTALVPSEHKKLIVNENPPTWATRLEQAWTRVLHLQKHVSSKLSHVSGMLYHVLFGKDWLLPSGPPKSPSIAQIRPFLNMGQLCFAGQSHIQAVRGQEQNIK